MSSEEKLEQSTIVKERGTMYFKVSLPRGPEHALEERRVGTCSCHQVDPSCLVTCSCYQVDPSCLVKPAVGGGRGGTSSRLWATVVHRVRQLGATEAVLGA